MVRYVFLNGKGVAAQKRAAIVVTLETRTISSGIMIKTNTLITIKLPVPYNVSPTIYHLFKVRVSLYQDLLHFNTCDTRLVGWLKNEKFKDIAILEDADLKQYSERSPNMWNNGAMNNPCKKVIAGHEFRQIEITFKC